MRLKGYDYSSTGSYFITICVKNRHELLGRVVGDAAIGVPCMQLSVIGNMVEQHIVNMGLQNGITIDKHVVMPNHVHILIHLDCGTPKAASPTKATIPQIINALKGLTSKEYGESMWQRSYHDHIIRNEGEYHNIWQYIDENPIRWEHDCYYKQAVVK